MPVTPYVDTPEKYKDQITSLLKMGLIAQEFDIDNALKLYGKLRLKAYGKHYETNGIYKPHAQLSDILNLISFDKKLRLLIFDMIETIEISFRQHLSYELTHSHGAIAQTNASTFLSHQKYLKSYSKIKESIDMAKINPSSYTSEMFNKYGYDMPFWAIKETLSYGELILIYSSFKDMTLKNNIGQKYNLDFKIFKSWLLHLKALRNSCAHHERIWNARTHIIASFKTNAIKSFNQSDDYANNRKLYNSILILLYFAKILNRHDFKTDIINLLKSQKKLLNHMGFPHNWQTLDTFS